MSTDNPYPDYGNAPEPNYGNQPPYGGQPGYGGMPAEHPRGTTILILGILSLVCCGLFTGIPAIIMGKSALDESKTAHYSNEGAIKAGWICGIIGTVLSVLGAGLQIILLATGNSLY
ncbi:DUF4190 domain-containing protein [Nocardioides sp. AE5]|uniref:DUF4190 domain-containing protein n=1 Tax=Nocardioides sp. AE5 TaxID=2962573 RepID=UPI00288262C2|nr:DUF4190 domain-containing protein [Nocardioides sp. AE5]MDT0202740.1 DUF4190 domain-containing protein [Nocardioides sp. AE5]